jgi:hypothetical protein
LLPNCYRSAVYLPAAARYFFFMLGDVFALRAKTSPSIKNLRWEAKALDKKYHAAAGEKRPLRNSRQILIGFVLHYT